MADFYGGDGVDRVQPDFVSTSVIRFPIGALPTVANDFISVGAGDDTVNGGGGGDTVYGGDGDDYIFAGLGIETLDGGAGTDWLDVTHWSGDYVISLLTGVTNYAGEAFDNFENIAAGGGDDSLTGTDGANVILGGGGRDTIEGRLGDDVLAGEAGNDILYGGAGQDFLFGGEGDDALVGGGGVDVAYGGLGRDAIYSSGQGRYLGEGDDDVVHAGALGGAETLDGGDGTDWLVLSTGLALGYAVDLATGFGNFAGKRFLGFENVSGGAWADTLTGTDAANSLDGRDGADGLSGGAGADILDGGAGDDFLDGGLGDDRLSGRDGNDVLVGGGGVDLVFGDGGADALRSGGAGRYYGQDGDDTLYAGVGGGPEALDGGAGTDLLDTTSWSGNYTVNLETGVTSYAGESFTAFENVVSGAGADILWGTDRDNTMTAGGGADRVFGRGGDDSLAGGEGADTLFGGLGADTLVGGAGADRFRFDAAAESRPGDRDVIRGFDGAGVRPVGAVEDRIDLASIDARTLSLSPGDDAFAFFGVRTDAQGLALGAGALWVTTVGTDTIVKGNVNGDAIVDLEIRIVDGATLASAYTAGDFFL
jgi:Ca2+-binding RTX toxin-like protein